MAQLLKARQNRSQMKTLCPLIREFATGAATTDETESPLDIDHDTLWERRTQPTQEQSQMIQEILNLDFLFTN